MEELYFPFQNLVAHVVIVVHRKRDEKGGGVLDVVCGVVRVSPQNHFRLDGSLESAPAQHRVVQ